MPPETPADKLRAALKKQTRHPYITGQGLKQEAHNEPAAPKKTAPPPADPPEKKRAD